jgi:hypothetical protein
MAPARKEPTPPDDIVERHQINSMYSSPNSQKARADAEASKNPGRAAQLRIDHYNARVSLKQRHERELKSLHLKHLTDRANASARQSSHHNVGPGSLIAVGHLPNEGPERKKLTDRHREEWAKQSAAQDAEMKAALRQHGHAK